MSTYHLLYLSLYLPITCRIHIYISMSTYLYLCIYISMSTHRLLYLSLHLPIYLKCYKKIVAFQLIPQYIYLYLPIQLYIHISMSTCLPAISISTPTYLPQNIYLYLPIKLYIHISMSTCLPAISNYLVYLSTMSNSLNIFVEVLMCNQYPVVPLPPYIP